MSQMMNAFWIVVAAALVTALIRFIPFLLFDHGHKPPHWIRALGSLLPPACMSVLVVYCLRNISLTSTNHGIPDLVCVALTMALHAWKRNTLLSICVGTLLYMLLVQVVF